MGFAGRDGELGQKPEGRKLAPEKQTRRPWPLGIPSRGLPSMPGCEPTPQPPRTGAVNKAAGNPLAGPSPPATPGQVARPAMTQHPMTSCHNRGIPSPAATIWMASHQPAGRRVRSPVLTTRVPLRTSLSSPSPGRELPPPPHLPGHGIQGALGVGA